MCVRERKRKEVTMIAMIWEEQGYKGITGFYSFEFRDCTVR